MVKDAIRARFDAAEKEAAIERFGRHVSSAKVSFYRSAGMDLVMGERSGAFFTDLDGRRFLNCHCNGGVFNLGHRHPRIVQALEEALKLLDIGNHHLMSVMRGLLAQRLAEGAPGDLDCVVFGTGGGEAIDLAIKLARGFTGRPGIVSALGGYHGHTGLALAAGDERYRRPFEPLAPQFHQVPFNDTAAMAQAVTEETAAVILETVPATAGMPIPAADYLQAVRRLCDERGALLVMDEVQTGLGRTGKLWGIEHFGVVPDIMVTAKGLSGGLYPISATIYRRPLDSFFQADPFIHISTFGGAELGCAAALAVLDVVADPGFLAAVGRRAQELAEGLEGLRRRWPEAILEIRQLGLMVGIVTASEMGGPLLSRLCFEEGLFAVYANNDRRVLQFLLPLIVTSAEVEFAVERLGRAVGKLAQALGH